MLPVACGRNYTVKKKQSEAKKKRKKKKRNEKEEKTNYAGTVLFSAQRPQTQ